MSNPFFSKQDSVFMQKALLQAKKALKNNEVPIGAVVVVDNKVIGRGFNQVEKKQSQICHAEIVAIQKACAKIGGWRLSEATMYVTLEPCFMCFGLIRLSRLKRLVFGTLSPVFGYSKFVTKEKMAEPELVVDFGLKEKPSADMLKEFFAEARKKRFLDGKVKLRRD